MHVPVLLAETIAGLDVQPSDCVVDATVGFGGHSEAILERRPSRLIGIDQDHAALEATSRRLGERITLIHGNFGNISDLLRRNGIHQVQKIVADLGISSFHLDASGRGFSFLKSEPLDMRMDSSATLSAREWLAKSTAKTLSDAFYLFGELIHNKKLVEAIISHRRNTPIVTTEDLNQLIKKSYHFGSRPMMMKIMSQVYQGIRIAINQELAVLTQFLGQLSTLLDVHGRVAIITFHSIEDRLVKHYFQGQTDIFKPINKKVITATEIELAENSRSKPAKLRVYERIR